MALTLTLVSTNGQILAQHNLSNSAVRIQAVDNVHYQLADANGLAPQNAQAGRVGNDLVVAIAGEPPLTIENYFLFDDSGLKNPLLGLQSNGQYVAYPLADSAPIAPAHVLAEEMAVSTASGTAAIHPAVAIASLIGVGAAGIALANSNNDDNNNNSPLPDQPQTPFDPHTNPPAPTPPTTTPPPAPPSGDTPTPPPAPNPTPVEPIAHADSGTYSSANGITLNVLANDTDPQGNHTLNPASVRLLDASGNEVEELDVAGQGKWTVNTTSGEITFIPAVGFASNPDAVQYIVRDIDNHLSNAATITLTHSNTPPVVNQPGSITLSGNATVGETLTATISDANGVPTSDVQYQWLADGAAITGATSSSYQLTQAEAGKHISVRATYTDNANFAENPQSTETAAVQDNTPPILTLSGSSAVQEGQSARYIISLDKAANTPITLTLTLTHHNSSDADLAPIQKNITLAAGATSFTLELKTVDDAFPENAESYTLAISAADHGELGAQTQVQTTILDNDETAANHHGSISASAFAGDRAADIPYFIQALDGGNYAYGHLHGHTPGTPLTIHYRFADSAYEAESGQTLTGFRPFSAAQQTDIKTVFAHLQANSGLTFIESTQATLNLYLDDLGEAADSRTVGYGRYGGNIHLNSHHYSADDAFTRDSHYFFNNGELVLYSGWGTALHEIGHSLGLDHPFEGRYTLPRQEDRDDLSIMSYTAGETIRVNVPGSNRYYPAVPVLPNKLGIYDLAALHYRYGVNPDHNAGDDTYTFRTYDQHADGNGLYIADGAGLDLFDASEQTLDLHIDLTPGSWIYAGDKSATLVLDSHGNPTSGQMFIGYGSQIESAKGGSGDDVIHGNSADNYLFGFDGDDHLFGQDGDDQLEGGRGADTLSGGKGADTFIFASPFDGSIDTLLDFAAGEGDLLQLSSHIFTALTPGTLSAEAFVAGKSATSADSRILYDQTSGELAYDADGNGSANAILIVRLAANTELEHQHILIV